MDHYLAINRANWDARAAIHAEGYMVEDLLADPAAISEVVAFDRPRLGDERPDPRAADNDARCLQSAKQRV